MSEQTRFRCGIHPAGSSHSGWFYRINHWPSTATDARSPPQHQSQGWRGGSDLEVRLQGEDDLFGLEPRFYRSSASYLNFLFA